MSRKTKTLLSAITLLVVALIAGTVGITTRINIQDIDGEGFKAEIQFSEEQLPAVVEDDMGEFIEMNEANGEEIKTVEEVDGGQFKDKDTGVSVTDGQYADLGWSEVYDTSSPEAFKNDTLGKCIIANNYYGAQCVSLARVFWWSYADRDVSTCGTGMAKGMMNCAAENAGDDFEVFWGNSNIQAGDWLVFNGGQYGHVGMALGPVVDGYVALLGENQGGHSCGPNVGGSATNIINISIRNLIGGYRPKAYIKPAPAPEPTPTPVDQCKVWNVKKGDTLGSIMKTCKGEIKWGEAMNEYARHWYSTTFKVYPTVYDGWISTNGVGLFAGDTIEYRAE